MRQPMRGFIGRVRDVAAAATSRSAAATLREAAAGACSAVGDSELEAALRRVTHSDCAAVPSEALHAVINLASESEEALAVVLRHVEEHATAPKAEWRRIHGALALLERLLRTRPDPAHGWSGPLVGRIWYEAKMQDRIQALTCFEYVEDNRVALLIRRVATSVRTAAEEAHSLADDQENPLDQERSPAADSRPESARSGGSGAVFNAVAGGSSPSSSGGGCGESKVAPSLMGRPTASASACGGGCGRAEASAAAAAAAANGSLRNAASALDALRDPGTRSGRPPVVACRGGTDARGSSEERVGNSAEGAQPRLQSALCRCCCLCLRRRQGPSASSGAVAGTPKDQADTEEPVYGEADSLLVA